VNTIVQCINDLAAKASTFKGQELVEKKELGVPEAPVWVPDAESKACTVCCMWVRSHVINLSATKFTFTNRRHHCRQCGTVVCGGCSQHKKQLPGQGRQRVCDTCYKGIGDSRPTLPSSGSSPAYERSSSFVHAPRAV
jgi:hypothetical protein